MLKDVLHELEAGLASPQRRRYLHDLVAGGNLKSEPDSRDVDLDWGTTAHSDPEIVRSRQHPPGHPQPVKTPHRQPQRSTGCI